MARVSLKPISAGDLEKFSYCPLSWWLSLKSEEDNESLAHGTQQHERLGRSLWRIDSGEKSARESEKIVFWWAIVATVVAIVGLEVLFAKATEVSEVLGVVALIWILAASYFLFKATKSKMRGTVVDYERIILIFAIVAVVIAVSAVAFSITADVRFALTVEAVAVMWLMGASYFLYRTLRATEIADSIRKEFRVIGKIEYIDMAGSKAFKSERYGLIGRPDYVIKMEDKIIPVEEKKGRTPKGPLFSHILQIAAYCLLIEESTGKTPPYGLLKYPEHQHEIEYNEDLKKVLLEKLRDMRKMMDTGEAHRNHNRPGKCKSCSRNESCPEKIV
jgi:CRISPR-associated exonuclease Cas4